jgi:PST family polysaccharide transporter
VAWSGIEAACAAALSVASALLVARIIGPAELGIGAAAVSVHVLLWVAVNALFGDALVQREAVDNTVLSSALWTSVAIGCVAMVLQAVSGWVLAALLDDRRLVPMALWLSLPLPLVGAAGVAQGHLTRSRGYGRLAGRTIVGQGLGTLAGVLAALWGAGAWATVGQQVTTSLVGAAALLIGGDWRPSPVWAWRPVRELLAVGLPLTASTLVQHARYRLFALLIGGTAGSAALGEVHVAFRLVDTVRELGFTALWRLMLPVLSERQNDRIALLASVDRLLALSSLVMLPACGAMAVTIRPLVSLLMGPRWAMAGDATEPLIALMAVMVLMFPSGVALVAVGLARYTLFANLAGLVAMVAAVLLIGPDQPLAAVLVWCASQLAVSPYALWTNARALRVAPLRPLRTGMPMLAVTVIAVAAALSAPSLFGVSGSPPSLIVLRVALVATVSAIGATLVVRRHSLPPVLSPAKASSAVKCVSTPTKMPPKARA